MPKRRTLTLFFSYRNQGYNFFFWPPRTPPPVPNKNNFTLKSTLSWSLTLIKKLTSSECCLLIMKQYGECPQFSDYQKQLLHRHFSKLEAEQYGKHEVVLWPLKIFKSWEYNCRILFQIILKSSLQRSLLGTIQRCNRWTRNMANALSFRIIKSSFCIAIFLS